MRLGVANPVVEDLLESSDHLVARDRHGSAIALPEVVERHGAGFLSQPTVLDSLSGLHPADRSRMARAWAEARAACGEVVCEQVRIRDAADRWRHASVSIVDLLDEPSVEAVLVATRWEPRPPDPAAPAGPAPGGVAWARLSMNPVGEIIGVEGCARELYGSTPDDLIGTNGLELVHPDDHEQLLEGWVQVVQNNQVGRALRHRVVSADGTETWVLATIARPDPRGPVYAHDVDITEQVEGEKALRASEERFRHLAAKMPGAVFVSDRSGRLVFANHRCARLAGLAGDAGWITELLDDEATRRWRALEVAGEAPFELETSAVGERVLGVRFGARQSDGTRLGVVEDATSAHRWRTQATHDPLTGVLNRRGLEAAFGQFDDDAELAVCFVDLDEFKAVNDLYGHAVGDELLAGVARSLDVAVRPGDLVARVGGDEFVVVARVAGRGRACELARRLTSAVDDADLDGLHLAGATVGVAWGHAGDGLEALLRRADEQMYGLRRALRS